MMSRWLPLAPPPCPRHAAPRGPVRRHARRRHRAGHLGPGRDGWRAGAGHAGRLLSAGPRAGIATRADGRFRAQYRAAGADGAPVGHDGPAAYARRGHRRLAGRRTRRRRDRQQTAALTRLEGGLRSSVGPAGFRVWLARTSFGVRPGVGGSLGNVASDDTTGGGGKQVVEYTDLGTRAALAFSRYEVGATLIRRWGSAALGSSALRSVAWEMNAVWWVRPSVGLVASVGHSLPELSLALPGARYRSLGVRLALGAPPRGGARAGGGAPPVTAVAAGTRASSSRRPSARHLGAGGGPRRGDGRFHRLAAPSRSSARGKGDGRSTRR